MMARTVPPSFVEIGPKLRVLIPLSWHKPKRAKNRGEPQKMTPSSETDIFLGWSQWESCSPGYSGHLLHWQKSDFWPSGGPLSFWVIFLMTRMVPLSFVEIGPKLRVVAPLTWEWPKTAKNRCEPQKMTPSSETEFFLGWFQCKICSPGYSGHLLYWQTSQSLYKKLTFGPKYSNFWVKKAHFHP